MDRKYLPEESALKRPIGHHHEISSAGNSEDIDAVQSAICTCQTNHDLQNDSSNEVNDRFLDWDRVAEVLAQLLLTLIRKENQRAREIAGDPDDSVVSNTYPEQPKEKPRG